MATALSLEGDGLVENLFQYLWTTDDLGGGPQVKVPSTVVYRGSQAVAWYFTSRKCGLIKRKNRANLTAAHIEQSFTKRKASTDIVAYHLCLVEPESASPVIEYFDATALHEFLFKRPDISHSSTSKTHQSVGILQQFSLPKGPRSSTLRAIWSPKLCLLERRENVHMINDTRFSVYERGVTFEEGGGVEALSRPDPVRGSILPSMVQQLCERVVDHVTRVSYHKLRIARMVLRLHVDANDQLWLLWSSSLRLQPPLTAIASGLTCEKPNIRPLDINSDAKVSPFAFSHALDAQSRLQSSAIRLKVDDKPCFRQTRCASCAQMVPQCALLPTTYKAVLAHFQHVLNFLDKCVDNDMQTALMWPPNEQVVQQAGGVGFGICRYLKTTSLSGLTSASRGRKQRLMRELIIPPVIRYVHPALRPEDYSQHRQDPIFLHKTVGVCEHCCLVYADYATASLEANAIGVRMSASAPALLRPVREKPKHSEYFDYPSELQLQTNSLSSPMTRGPHTSASRCKPSALAWKPVRSDEGRSVMLPSGPRCMLDSLPKAPKLPPRISAFSSNEYDAHWIPLSNQNDKGCQHQQEGIVFQKLYQQNDTENCGSYALRHMLDQFSKAKPLHRLAALGKSTRIGQSQSTGALVDAISELQLKTKITKSPYSIVQKICGGNGLSRSLLRNFVAQNEFSINSPTQNEMEPVKKKRLKKSCKKGQETLKRTRYTCSRELQAAAEHRSYLEAILSDAQAQHIESLATLVIAVPLIDAVPTEHDLMEAEKHRNEKEESEKQTAISQIQVGAEDKDEQRYEESKEHESERMDGKVAN